MKNLRKKIWIIIYSSEFGKKKKIIIIGNYNITVLQSEWIDGETSYAKSRDN